MQPTLFYVCLFLILCQLHTYQCIERLEDVCREPNRRNIHMMPANALEHFIWPKAASQNVIDSFITNIAQKRKPVVISDYPLDEHILPTLNNIVNQQAYIPVIKSNKNCPILEYFHEELPLSQVLDNWQKPNINVYNLTFNEIEDILSTQSKRIYDKQAQHDRIYECYHNNAGNNKNKDDYYVLTMNLLNYTQQLSVLRDTFCPKNVLIDGATDLHQNEEYEGMNLWFGYYGFLTQLHYDASDNFNIQIKGKKLFRLISPKYYKKLYLYPWLHPLSRKSQLTHSSLLQYRLMDENDWKLFKEIEIYQIELNAGEILYIPPFWFHEVVSINYPQPSWNINVVSYSIEKSFQHYLFQFPVMINVRKHSKHRFFINALALKSFFSQLLKEFGWNPHKIIRTFIKSSYDPLVKNLDNDSSLKYKKKMKKMCKKVKQIEGNTFSVEDQEKYVELIKWYNEEVIAKQSFKHYSQQIHEWMMKNKGPHTQMMIMSYIEIFTYDFLPINAVYYFFKYCF